MSDIYLISSELRSTSANNSNTVTCTQNSHLTTAEAFIFFVSYVSVGGFNDLTIDENSKTLTIDHIYNDASGDSKNYTSGSFNNKFSSLLLISGLLL